ncbi:MAG TPA: PAS domain S-box protein [Candidatus Eisenbacteria bacterium]|nr:PAS domain S-box protein [Candidatus Eisenbacteria bacterium]
MLALAIAIPLLAIMQVQVRSTHRSVEENEALRGAALARLGAMAVDEYLRGIADYAEAYAEHPEILQGANRRDERAVRAVLARLIRGNPRVDRTFVTDVTGVEWSDYPRDPSVIGKNFAFRDWFRGVSSGETTYVSSSYHRMAGRQERSIAIATPIRSGTGPVSGYLVAQVLVSSLERQLAQPVRPDSGGIVVIDRDRAVVTELGFPPGSAPGVELGALVRAKDGGGSLGTIQVGGAPYLVAASPSPTLGGRVLALRSLRAALAPARAMELVVFLLVLAVALLLALFVTAMIEQRSRRIAATERERAEATLRESERRFRATFEQAAVGIAHLSLAGAFVRVNQRLCDILGYSRSELLHMRVKEFMRPEDLAGGAGCPPEEVLQHIGEWKEGICRVDQELKRKDGTMVWCHLTLAPVSDGSGTPEYFTAVVEDITERKRLEEQFLQAQKMRAIGQLAGGVAHDFNNLLTTILGYCELIQRKLPVNDALRGYVDEIAMAGQRAAALTSQLLAFGRKQILRPLPVNLNSVIEDMDRLLRRLVGDEVQLETRLDPKLGTVRADQGQMEQVLMNLVLNARDALPHGGRVTLETRNEWIESGSAPERTGLAPGAYAVVSVKDTGVGMDSAVRAQLFEPFFTTKEKGKGTGLGLSTVYGIVKQSGGGITVQSEPGQGSRFEVYLPTAKATDVHAPRVSEPHPEEGAPAGGSETILLVEDDATLRALTHRVLEERGYRVLEAPSGIDALAMVERIREPIHLLLTDVVMPRMSGAALAEGVRDRHPATRVVFMSGYTDEAVVRQAAAGGGIRFIQKPYKPEGLLRTIRAALDAPDPVSNLK